MDTATTAARLGDSLLDLRSFDESQILLLQAESVYEVRGQAYVTNRAAIQSSLGRLYRSVGRYAEAERRYRRAIELASQYNAARNPNIALYTRSLADLYLVTGRKDEARNQEGASGAALARRLQTSAAGGKSESRASSARAIY